MVLITDDGASLAILKEPSKKSMHYASRAVRLKPVESMGLRRRYDVLEHHGERLTPVNRRVGCPFEDRVNLIPDGLPLGTLASQVEVGQ